STRVLFVTGILGFTGASVLCATASSLGQMIVYRAMQGFCGGAIMPIVWPVVYSKFRGRQLATGIAIMSVILSPSPAWGPTSAAVTVSAISSTFFFWRVLTYHQPIVDVRAFLNRNFALGAFFTFTIGLGMYGTTYLVPLFLAQVRGYSALQIGLTVIVVGLVTMVMSPASAYMARKLDLRVMLSIGLGLFAFSMYLTATLTNQTSFWELFVPQAVRGLGLICCYLPANLIALGSLSPDNMRNAAGLYNLTRDLGGAIGLATIGTVMNDRLHFHWNRLIEDINPARRGGQHFRELP